MDLQVCHIFFLELFLFLALWVCNITTLENTKIAQAAVCSKKNDNGKKNHYLLGIKIHLMLFKLMNRNLYMNTKTCTSIAQYNKSKTEIFSFNRSPSVLCLPYPLSNIWQILCNPKAKQFYYQTPIAVTHEHSTIKSCCTLDAQVKD